MTEVDGLLVRIEATTEMLRRQMQQGDAQVAKFEQSVNSHLARINKAFDTLGSGAAKLIGIIGGFQAARGLVEMIDATNRLSQRLAVVTANSKDAATAQDQIFAIAQKTGQSIESVTVLYTRMALATRELGVSQQQLARLTELVTKAVATSGATSQEAAAGIIQFTQALALGKFQGQDLKAVLEDIPGLGNAIAAGLQLVAPQLHATLGNLRQLGSDGKLSSDLILRALLAMGYQIDATFSRVPQTLEQAWTKLENQVLKAVGVMDDGSGITEKLTAALKQLQDVVADPNFARGMEAIGWAVGTAVTRIAEAFERLGAVLDYLGRIKSDITGDLSGISDADLSRQIDQTTASIERLQRAQQNLTAGGIAGSTMAAQIADQQAKLARLQAERLSRPVAKAVAGPVTDAGIHGVQSGPTAAEQKQAAEFAQRLADIKSQTAATDALAAAWARSSNAAMAAQRSLDIAKKVAGLPNNLTPGQRAEATKAITAGVDGDRAVKVEQAITSSRELNDLTAYYNKLIDQGLATQDDLTAAVTLYNQTRSLGLDENNPKDQRAVQTLGEQITRTQELAKAEQNREELQNQRNSLEQAQLELAYLGKSTDEYQIRLAVLQQIQSLRQRHIDLGSSQAEAEIANARALANVKIQIDRASAAYQELQDIGEQAFDRIGSAITEMAVQGGDAWKGFGNVAIGVLSEVYQALIKLAVINPLMNSLLGGTHRTTLDDFTSGLTGWLGNLINGSTYTNWYTAASAPGASFGGLEGGIIGFRAAGGPVSSGMPYVVGERGPELFVPRGPGVIIPNGASLGAANSNVRVEVNVHSDVPQQVDRQEQRQRSDGTTQIDLYLTGRINDLASRGKLNKGLRTQGTRQTLTQMG